MKTFSEFAKDQKNLEQLIKDFDYKYYREVLDFSKVKLSEQQKLDAQKLEQETIISLKIAEPNNEQIKREALIFPVLKQLGLWQAITKLETEYKVIVEEDKISVNGNIDYLVWNKQKELLVIEAKNDDFVGGNKQLIAEMIAIKIVQQINDFYGAISNGVLWQFFHLKDKKITQDVQFYSFPQSSIDLFQVLLNIFQEKK